MKNKGKRSVIRKIGAVLLAILVVLTVVLNVAAEMFSPILDSYLGRGKLQVSQAEGVENWDTEYYSKKEDSLAEAKKTSNKVSQQVCEEGIVLLKNNGVLPLAEKTEVTPF